MYLPLSRREKWQVPETLPQSSSPLFWLPSPSRSRNSPAPATLTAQAPLAVSIKPPFPCLEQCCDGKGCTSTRFRRSSLTSVPSVELCAVGLTLLKRRWIVPAFLQTEMCTYTVKHAHTRTFTVKPRASDCRNPKASWLQNAYSHTLPTAETFSLPSAKNQTIRMRWAS